jgi:hypothetical protein
MRVVYLLGKPRQIDMDGPIRCSLLTLEPEEHLKQDGTCKLIFVNVSCILSSVSIILLSYQNPCGVCIKNVTQTWTSQWTNVSEKRGWKLEIWKSWIWKLHGEQYVSIWIWLFVICPVFPAESCGGIYPARNVVLRIFIPLFVSHISEKSVLKNEIFKVDMLILAGIVTSSERNI